MRTKFLFNIIMLSFFINNLYGQQKEEVYLIVYNAKFPVYIPISFLIIDSIRETAKTASFDVNYSHKGKIKSIDKRLSDLVEKYEFVRLENGNIWVESCILKDGKKHWIRREYYSTYNFKNTDKYKFVSSVFPDLFSKNNYELLEYLDNNYSKYYGTKDKNVPLLKKRE